MCTSINYLASRPREIWHALSISRNSMNYTAHFMKFKRYALAVLLLVIAATHAQGQRKIASYEKYIKQYSNLAIQHDKKYNIPASITLAQAILESGAGQARLAKEANNHFGIKCHADWKGGRIYHDDDKRNECFRKYKNVSESYDDHSTFLAQHSRYSRLFKLDKKDYRGWAKGLQDCGYATDRGYANKLINIIETYQLYQYDQGGKSGKTPTTSGQKTPTKKPGKQNAAETLSRDVYKTHGLIYVLARANDSLEDIAKDMNFKAKKLAQYNEMPVNYPLRKGDIVYLEKKKKKTNKPYYNHKVQVGESMHSISQRYGVQMKQLYKINQKDADYVPTEGDMLKLR